MFKTNINSRLKKKINKYMSKILIDKNDIKGSDKYGMNDTESCDVSEIVKTSVFECDINEFNTMELMKTLEAHSCLCNKHMYVVWCVRYICFTYYGCISSGNQNISNF